LPSGKENQRHEQERQSYDDQIRDLLSVHASKIPILIAILSPDRRSTTTRLVEEG
jgi:hypothetical protein